MIKLKAYSPYYTEKPKCRNCGSECKRAYFNAEHKYIGCEECIYSLDARYVKECKPVEANYERRM